MIILGFDTATPDTVVGLTGIDAPVELRHSPAPGERPGHTRELLPLASEALRRAGVGWRDLDRVAVGVGPGTFTGLRIGVATARALAQAAGAALVGVSSLRALAAAAQEQLDWKGPVLAVLDARRGEAFVAGWCGEDRVVAPAAVRPDGLGAVVSGYERPWLAVGDGALKFAAYLEPVGVSVPAEGSALHRISGLVVCRLAERAAPTDREALVPEYVRAPDAELRAGRQPAT